MEKFLDQFKLSPMMRVKMENYIFSVARAIIVDYNGGFWTEDYVGQSCILAIPSNGKPEITLRCEAMGWEVTTDIYTASAAFTALVVNWFWNTETDKMGDDANDEFATYHFALRDDVYQKKASHNLDLSAYMKITD